MRKLILALAAVSLLSATGCRLFCGDCPSKSYYGSPPDVTAQPVRR